MLYKLNQSCVNENCVLFPLSFVLRVEFEISSPKRIYTFWEKNAKFRDPVAVI